jgi:hypothetical protein
MVAEVPSNSPESQRLASPIPSTLSLSKGCPFLRAATNDAPRKGQCFDKLSMDGVGGGSGVCYRTRMPEQFTRHRQPWKSDEIQKLHTLAGKGKGLKEIAKALNRSEESTKDRAKADGVGIAKLR